MPEVEINETEEIEDSPTPIEEGPDFSAADGDDEPNWEAKSAELEAELETETKRRKDTQRDWQEQQKAIGYYEGILDQLEEDSRAQESYAQQAAQAPPPTIEDPDDLLTDGNKLLKFIQERDQYIVGNLMAQMQPVAVKTQQHDALMGKVMRRAQKDSYEEADKLLSAEYDDYKSGDLAKVWNTVDQALRRSNNHQELRMDPEALVHTYSAIRRHKKRGEPRPVRHQAGSPVGLSPSAPGQRGGALPPIPAQFRMMAKRLGRNPAKVWKRHVESGGKV